jgi:hypothetical protein
MWVYYAILLLVFLVVGIKAVDFIAEVFKNRREAVRKEDWLVSILEALSK